MRADAALADRRLAVRTAAESWRSAGLIDDSTSRAIATSYPDDRSRLRVGLRILAGVATLLGGGAVILLIASVVQPRSGTAAGILGLVFAFAFVAATELQTGRLRRAQAGAEYATALLAAICAGFASGELLDAGVDTPMFLCVAAAFGLAAWRWGHASFAAVASLFLVMAVSRQSFGRIGCIVLGAASIPIILRLARSPLRPPALRRSLLAAGLVLLAGAYFAVNFYSVEHQVLELLRYGVAGGRPLWLSTVSIAGTMMMPVLVVVLALRYRDRALLAAGALFAAASLLTLRQYYPIGPWWLIFVFAGVGTLAFAIALRRWLSKGPAQERSGFTAEPLFENGRLMEAAQAAAVVAAMSPAAREATEPGFSGGGGRSGGGGATGTS